MPVKPLPLKLVRTLRRIASKQTKTPSRQESTYRLLRRLKNIDSRRNPGEFFDTSFSGHRVRELNVSRNFPKIKRVVIKRVHSISDGSLASASQTLRRIKEIVRNHNKKYPNARYILLSPHAYVIGGDLVAMAKTNAPTVYEVLPYKTKTGLKWHSVRGRRYWKKYIEPKGFEERFREDQSELGKKTKLDLDNVLVLAPKKGNFVFIPLVDVY